MLGLPQNLFLNTSLSFRETNLPRNSWGRAKFQISLARFLRVSVKRALVYPPCTLPSGCIYAWLLRNTSEKDNFLA